MKYLFRLLLLAVFALLAGIWFGVDDVPDGDTVQIPPKPSASSGIYVQDYAGIISAPVRGYLQNLGQQLEQKTTAQLVVVTVKSLDGAPLEDYSLKLLRNWGIGNKGKNNGVLLLISTGDRKSRVEVGYGLEGALTDSLTGKIQDQYMIPYFRKGTYEPGIAYGYEALALRIAKEYNVQLAVSGYNNHSPGTVRAGSEGQSTEELFEKAMTEQNGNKENVAQTYPAEGHQNSGVTEKNVTSAEGDSGLSGADSSLAAGVLGVLGFLLMKGEMLVDTVGWVPLLLILIFLDIMFLHGVLTRLLFRILAFFFSGGGGSGGGYSGGGYGGGSSGGGFGGGSGGGGGSSRSW